MLPSPQYGKIRMQRIIEEGFINFAPEASDKCSVVAEMAEVFFSHGRINDREAYIENVFKREAVSSTDTGIGIAIPHGKGDCVTATSVAISRFPGGLIWDEEPVRAVFLLAVDDDEKGLAHLEILAKVSTMLMDDDFVNVLFTAESEAELFNEIIKRLEEEK